MKLEVKSTLTGKYNVMDLDVTEEQVDRIANRWNSKELIQDIVPNLKPYEREFLISGTSPQEWKENFGGADG